RQKQGAEQTAGRLLAGFYDADADEDGLLTLAEAQTILPELTQAEFNQCEVHVDGLLSETELQIVAYGDPASYAALIGWLTGFHEEFAAYTNPDPLILSVVRTLAVSANQAAILLDAGLGYSYADRDAIEAFLNDLNTFVFGDDSAVPQETITALKALDPKTIAKAVLDGYTGLEPEDIDEILEHIDVYATDNAAVEQVKEAAAAILIQAREIVVVLKTYELQDFAAANLRAFSTALAAYADDFAAAHPDVVGAQAAAIAAHAFDDIVEALEVLEPAVDEVVDDMVQLLEDLDNPDESILDPATYETAFGDLAEFFEDYADTTDHGDDALADLIAVYLRGLEEIAGLLVALDVELDALAYAEMQGALSELLPDWPMDITLDAFGIGEQADCLAAQVTIPEPVEEEQSKQDEPVEHVVSMTIFAKDVGPALYGPLTLFSATIDGVELGGNN
ncbi:MAG: hypothetical protein HYZ00_03575, partial [Candidatus Hydrogenedentes bacterium]|nr:hypothetical protein [Candidatus Hydrogenedentota bacterium]